MHREAVRIKAPEESAAGLERMPRCCRPLADDFAPSYASALVAGPAAEDLQRAVESLESERSICPCVTAWCPECKRVSCVVQGRRSFPTPSAFFAHALAAHAAIEATLRLAQGRSF